MILYYSSTGNSKHVADRLGKALHTEPVDICLIKEETINLNQQDLFFITFNCFWGVSEKVNLFISQTNFKNVGKVIFILTCGGFLGGADRQVEELCEKKHLPKPLIYELKMVGNYSILHDVPALDTQKRKLKKAEIRLKKIIQGTANTYKSLLIMKIIQPYIHAQYKKYQNTKPFHVSASCISCSLCAIKCPISAIQMENGKPKWIKEQCDNCLKCLHHCPTQAINYGQSTTKRRRYRYPD